MVDYNRVAMTLVRMPAAPMDFRRAHAALGVVGVSGDVICEPQGVIERGVNQWLTASAREQREGRWLWVPVPAPLSRPARDS
jgi:hypothetical protein